MPDRYLQRAGIFPRRRDPAVRASKAGGLSATELSIEIVGYAGALLILGSYILLTAGKVDGRSTLYQGMNLAGAIGFVINGWWHRALPSAILNIVWALIAIVALWRARRRA